MALEINTDEAIRALNHLTRAASDLEGILRCHHVPCLDRETNAYENALAGVQTQLAYLKTWNPSLTRGRNPAAVTN
jgi:hypothetical protein